MSSTLNGRVALVTGASRGIGHAIALALGRCGAAVVGTATSPEGVDRIDDSMTGAGVVGHGIVLDVADGAAVETAFEEAQRRFGDVTILINNAAITRDSLLLRMRDDQWDQVLETDLKSVFRLCKLA